MDLLDFNGKTHVLFFIIMELYCVSMVTPWEMDIVGYYHWTPTHSTRTDLYCPNKCEIGDHRVKL